MEKEFFYKTTVTWKDGRKGELSAPDLASFIVATPPEFPKGVPNIWSPEHLYVASANVCLMTTFLAIAENSKLEFESFSCEGIGKLEKVEGKFMISEIELKPKVVIKDESQKERTQRIVEKSEANCLISHSMKTKIILSTEVVVEN